MGNLQKKFCCYYTKLDHLPANCCFKTAKVHNCHKVGHFKKARAAERAAKDVRQAKEDSPPLSNNKEFRVYLVNPQFIIKQAHLSASNN